MVDIVMGFMIQRNHIYNKVYCCDINVYTGWNSSAIVVSDKCVCIELKLISAQVIMLEYIVMWSIYPINTFKTKKKRKKNIRIRIL